MNIQGRWLLAVVAFALALPLAAQEPAAPGQAPAEEPAAEVEEVIVVTASRTEQALNDSPSAITVISAKDIESIPADDYGDLLRNVPGLNVSQTSARDINMTARGSTNTLSTSQLVMLDGRSIYLDFFGFVMWDFLPVNPGEIKQIEAVRGPGSAVWGANAMTGVVNLITKRPKEMVGTSLLLGGGELGTWYGGLTHAGVSGNFGYKLSGGYFEQDPYERPVIPGVQNFPNSGTQQPKFDARFDWDLAEDSVFTFAGGYAGTDGIVHSGIGPFDIEDGANLSYGKLNWHKQAFNIGVFANFLDADSTNLVSVGVDGLPLGFQFTTETYSLDLSNTSVAGAHNIFTYGGNYRTSDFELEIAQEGTSKDEWGVFLQDEILIGDKVRWLIGARYDEIDPLEDGVVSPRTSLLFSPQPNHTFRISYNEAFRTPSVINNYLDATILVGQPPLVLPAHADGNVALNEEQMTAYEAGYVGTFDNGMILTLSVYHNEIEDSIDFYNADYYGPANLPIGLIPPPLPPTLAFCFAIPPTPIPLAPPALQGCPQVAPGVVGFAGLFPSDFSYRNIGKTTDEGAELSLQQRRGDWSWFFNASYQQEPEFEGLDDTSDQNLPPEWRANLGLAYDVGTWFWSANVNYQDEAFWADVPLAVGFTDSFTQLNVALGVRFLDERMTLQVTGANVTDEDVQQHYYGDIISRKVTGQLGFRF